MVFHRTGMFFVLEAIHAYCPVTPVQPDAAP